MKGKTSFILKNEQEWKYSDVKQHGTLQNCRDFVLETKILEERHCQGQNICHPLSSVDVIEIRQ